MRSASLSRTRATTAAPSATSRSPMRLAFDARHRARSGLFLRMRLRPASSRGRRPAVGAANGRSTVKVAPAPGMLATLDASAHLVDQALGDGEPEPGAAMPPRRTLTRPARTRRRCGRSHRAARRVRCRARRSEARRFAGFARAPGASPSVKATPPVSVNLMALPTRFIRIWRRRISSPITVFGRSGAAQPADLQTFVAGARREQLDHALAPHRRCRRARR